MRLLSLAAAIVLLSCPPASAQKPEELEAARALLERAADATHVRSPETAAFHLKGRFVLAPYSKQKLEGTYALNWVSPEKWREEIGVGGARRIRVGDGGRVWQTQEIGMEVAIFYIVSRVLDVRTQVLIAKSGEVRDVSNDRKQGRPVQCVKTRLGPKREREICVDAERGVPVTETVSANGYSTTYEYGEFARVGNKWFPRSVKAVSDRRKLLEFSLEEVETSSTPAESLFSRPAGAQAWTNCDYLETSSPKADLTKGLDAVTRYWKIAYAYGTVEADGSVHTPQILYSLSEKLSNAFLQKLSQTLFEPSRCEGRAVASERIFVLDIYVGGSSMNEENFTLAAFRGLLLE